MCGIAGILSTDPRRPPSAEALRRMSDALVHRGPDDAGVYVDPTGRCGLAFRRLSIIDVEGGAQPLSNEDGTIWIVFNGEIYNFLALREELARRGHVFRTRSDTEVIVHLFEERGAAAFDALDGMFALALWDGRRQELHLARDRLGKKPLVYAQIGDQFLFASETKALLALPDVPRRLDPQALHEYLVFQYVPAPRSIYQRLRRLPPGCRLTLAPGTSPPPPSRYAELPRDRFGGSYDDALRRLDELLVAAVRKRLIADVPLGAFLSGGVDSSVVAVLMQRLGVSPLRTFSIGFDDAAYDEREHARQVARRVGAEHHEFVVTPEALPLLETLAWHLDEPFADSSVIPTWFVSHHTRRSVTVALTGDGGDECFLGYDRYRALQIAGRLGGLPLGLRRGLRRAAGWLPRGRSRSAMHRAYRFLSAIDQPPARRYLNWMQGFAPDVLASAYSPAFAERIDAPVTLAGFDAFFAAGFDPVEAANRCDFERYLPFDLLTKVDLMSMACSLECRCPLLDRDLVAFALSLPQEWKMDARGGKRILRDWASAHLPGEILNRPKMGFGVPVGGWFRGPLAPILRDLLTSADAISRRIFRPGFGETLLEEHESGRFSHDYRLWSLLMLELWSRRWHPEF